MARLILLMMLIAAVLLAIGLLVRLARPVGDVAPRPAEGGDTLPDTFKTIAYGLLILLMFGVVTGWLGGL